MTEIDEKYRRTYNIKNPSPLDMNKTPISAMERLENLNKSIQGEGNFSKFYKLSVGERLDIVNSKSKNSLDRVALQTGGLSL